MKRDNMSRHNFKILLVAGVVLLLLLCLLSFIMAPATDTLEISSFNPIEIINGGAFMLGFGFGCPIILSYLLIVLILAGLWFCLFWLIRQVVRLFI